ncbi:hypothetical protein GCM10007173_17610 [Glutamicibacter ardleyensis]|uniref:Uncharacterized protein n=1 Tax=Glutamicibacter ardleyensis TaxID=225894 RepID=A0ABQ2DIZ3_9MICC|nr:hypothetical protein GCM10007173_17610 [Glutamicibacter ardleyensis]
MGGGNDHHVTAIIPEAITSHDGGNQGRAINQVAWRAQIIWAKRLVVEQFAKRALIVRWFVGAMEH